MGNLKHIWKKESEKQNDMPQAHFPSLGGVIPTLGVHHAPIKNLTDVPTVGHTY